MQAITAALAKLREWTPAHVRVGASANGFKTSTTEWLGGGTTPGMVVPDGMLCFASDSVTVSSGHCGSRPSEHAAICHNVLVQI